MSNGKESIKSWLVPALVGASVALFGSVISSFLTSRKDTLDHMRGVASVRAQIIESATGKSANRVGARLSLDYVLKPIDKTGEFNEFSSKVSDIFADKAAETSPGADRESLQAIAPPIPGEIADLISKFTGPERLAASNALVERAKSSPVPVVDALISGLREQDDEASYRFNLYVVFTLARIPNGWPGTDQQRERLIALRSSRNYKDATFHSRTEEAISNWQKR